MTTDILRDCLVCPLCHSDLEYLPHVIRCSECKKEYPQKEGVPVLLPPELLDSTVETKDPIILRKRYEAKHFASITQDYQESLEMAWDQAAPYTAKIHRLMETTLKEAPKNSRILDIGGTSRWWLNKLDLREKSVVLDISSEWLVSIKKKEGWPNLTGADCEMLPFRAGYFDIILVNGVLHHVPRKELACREIARVLKQGGVAVIVEPAKWSVALIYYMLKRCVYAAAGAQGVKKYLKYYGSPFESYLSPRTVRKVFNHAEFSRKIRKSTPLRLPYVGGLKHGQAYFRLLQMLENSVLTKWFGSYLLARIQKRRDS